MIYKKSGIYHVYWPPRNNRKCATKKEALELASYVLSNGGTVTIEFIDM
jgi:hypothetical protein